MTKNMLACRKLLALTKVRKLGVTGISTSLLVTSNAALAHGSVPTFMPVAINHPLINASQFTGSTGSWQVQTNHTGGSTSMTARSSTTAPLPGSRLGTNGKLVQHWLIKPSGFTGLSTMPRQNTPAIDLSAGPSLAGTELNLQSGSKNILLGSSVFQGAQSVTIKVGGLELTFTPGQKVTAAEYLAISEVVSSGTQTLKLNGSGVAVAGTFALSNTGTLHLSELIIPANVTALDNLTAQSSLSLSGDLLNYGSLYGYAAGGQADTGLISAKDIVNEKSGLVSTQLPASLLSSIGTTLSNVNLTLNAAGSITNEGKIVSGGSLNIVTGSGILNNSGTVSSVAGNINILTRSPATDITISADGGTFQAQNGAINLRQSDCACGANVNLTGGNYLSNSLNIFSGTGVISGNVENVSGQINSQAGVEHLAASSANLTLGTNTVTGDPTFVNNGNITISGVNTFSEDVTIIANGNITGTNGAEIVDSGHNVILIAGVAPGAGRPSSGTVTGKSSGISGSTTIDFASSSNKGGNIDFTAGAASTVIDTSSSTYTSGGGSVTLAAFAKGATGGDVLFNSSSTINTSASADGGTGTNNGGNVTIVAGANPATGTVTVQVGNIITSGSNGQQLSGFIGQPPAVAGTGGSVNITTTQPTATGGTTVTFNSSGDITAGGPIVASSTINNNAQVSVGNVLTGAPGEGGPGVGGDINITAGSNITSGSLATYGTIGSSFMNAEFPVSASVGGNAGNVSIQSVNGGISISGAINSAGGAGGDGGIMNVPGSSQAEPGAAGGNGGTVTLQSSTDITMAGGISTSGGLGGSGVNGNPASAGGAGGNGGSIAVSTNNGNVSISGSLLASGSADGNGGMGAAFSFPPAGAINGVAGSAGGNGGQITLNAGTGAVSIAGLLNSGGGAGGNGGDGFTGVPNSPASTPGGQGGNGGNGGAAGAITFQAGAVTTDGGFEAFGGAGGSGGNGGNGVANPPSSAGGNGGSGGNGGAAGVISFTATNFSGPLSAVGGTGGAAGADGALAPGGSSGTPGTTGAAANISVTSGGTTAGAITGSNISIASPAGISLTLSDNVTASGTITIAGGATVQITGSTNIVGTSVAINGVSGDDLTVAVTGASAAIVATSGDITVTGATGNSVVVNNAGTVSALNGDIYLSSMEAVVSSNAGGNISIGGGGTFQVGSGVINISASTQSGSPAANRIEFTGSQTLMGNTVLNAGAQTQLVQIDDGATVVGTATVTVNSSILFEIGSGTLTGSPLVINSQTRGGVIANTSGTLDLSTLGSLVFNGQSLAILSVAGITDNGNAVSIDLSSTSATGGNLSLIAGYNFTPNSGSLNYPPLDTTSTFMITSAGTGSITLGNTSINTSGNSSGGGVLAVANGAITLGTISTNATAGAGGSINIIGSGVTLTGNVSTTSSAGAGLGGSVSIIAASPVLSGTIVVGGGFVAGGSFTPGIASGSISVSGITIGAAAINLTANGTGAGITTSNQLSGGNINLVTTGAINLASNQPFAVQNDAAGNGGTLSLTASSLTWVGSASQALSLNASAAGASGNGGSIVVSLQSAALTNIGTQAGMIELSATGGISAGSSGAVTFNTGGSLTVAPAGINVGPGAGNSNGGQITLAAGVGGAGSLLVTGALSANGSGNGNGGTINLESNSATTFNIGSTAKTNTNGVLGALTASGADGTLEIINEGGGITNAVALSSANNLTESVGGTGILALGSSLSANKGLQVVSLSTDKGTITKSGTLTTAKIILQSTGGNIGTSGTGFSVIAGEVQASASGLVNITDTIKSDVSLDASTAGTSFKLVSSGALTIDGTVTAGTAASLTTSGTNLGITINGDVMVNSATGTAALTATGRGTISQTGAGGIIQANTLTFKTTSGPIGTPVRALDIDAGVLNLTTTGAINVANSGSANLTVNGSPTKGTFDLTSDGGIIIAKAISSATAYSLVTDAGSNGSITVNAAVGGNYATSIIVAADGSGNVASSTSGKLQTKVNGTVTVTSGSGNIGSGTTSKTTLNIYTTNLSANTGGSGFVNVASKLTSAVEIKSSTSGGVFDLYSAGSSLLDGITSNGGGINVTETTGTLTLNDASTIHAGNGSITLENVNKSSGTIDVGNGSKITTMSAGTTGGQVSIVLGPVPSNPVAGTAPSSGLTVNQVSGGSVFFCKGITVLGPVNTINLQGSDVVFNVGTRPITAITLGGGVTITADPVSASAPAPVFGATILSLNMPGPDQPGLVPLTGPTIAAPPVITQIQSSAVGGAAYAGNGVPINYVAGGLTAASGAFTASSVTNLGLSINAAISDNVVNSNDKTFTLAGQNISYRINEPGWMSDTELQTGEIPAVVFDGDSLGIKNEVSSILELEDMNDEEMAVNNQLALVRSDTANLNSPLTGCVSKNIPGGKTRIVKLRRGTVVFAPTADTLVFTPVGNVKVAANSVAMIMAFAKGVAVYNLLDRHKDAIVVKTGEINTSILPGGVTIICASGVQNFRDINPTQAIGYRNLQSRKLDGNVQTFSCQFSIVHAIVNVMPLRAMLTSKNAHTKKIGAQLLKTAAILDQLNGSDYQQVVRPTTTAFLQ